MDRIIFEFVGGPNDGKVFDGTLGDASDAERYFLLTNRGTVGQRFKVASDYAVETLAREQLKEEKRHFFQRHYYVVTDRIEDNGEVLVRAEYVEKDRDKGADGLVRDHLESAADQAESRELKIQRYLRETAKSIGQSYSHYWPADEPSAQEPPQNNLSLHIAHVLLSEKFSVFAAANHRNAAIQAIDLLGIAPSQDWFVACEFTRLCNPERLESLLQDVGRLESFWLNTRLTIEACSEHIVRVANHCEAGYGLIAGLHWLPENSDPSRLFEFWTTHRSDGHVFEQFAQKLRDLNALWPEPIAVRHYAGRGTYYLLSAFFEIRR